MKQWLTKLQDRAGGVWELLKRPAVWVIVLTILLLSKVISLGRLTYGDIPVFDVHSSHINFLYAWGPQQFGTNVRQSFNTVRDELFALVAHWNTYLFYFLKYLLPILLIPLVYLWVFKKLGIRRPFVLITASLSPLFTPVLFGDFLTGQTFWIYLLLPIVLFLAIRIFCLRQFNIRNYLLLAVFLFLSLGALPPIIVPLLATLTIFGGVNLLLSASIREPGHVGKYVLAGVVVGGVFLLLSAPYLLAGSSGQAAYTPASLLGDYYHNYSGTDLLNTLRLAGNNGNGQSTLAYNVPSPLNMFGYLLVALVLGGSVLIGVQRRGNAYKTVVASLLTTWLCIVGFMYIMAIDPLVGTKIFQSQWIVSTIRNPSKLYVIMLPIFITLLAFSLENFMSRYRVRWQQVSIATASVLLIAVYGWPALRGDLGLLFHKSGLANYKTDPTDQIIARSVPTTERSLLVPANHRDELNYQNINPGFNILELEGGQPTTTKFVQQMNRSFNNKDDYFFNYLAAGGIQNVFAKKDQQAYQASLFDLFPVSETPQQTHNFLASQLKTKTSGLNYWRFSNPAANPLVFSPQHIVDIQGSDELALKAPFMGLGTAVLSGKPPNPSQRLATTYQAHTELNNSQTIVTGKAQLHDPRLLLVDLYARNHGNARQVVFDVLNPITNTVQQTITKSVAPDASVIMLGNDRYTFSDQKKRATIRSGDYQMSSASLQSVNISGGDPSFEKSVPAMADATPKAKGKANFTASNSHDAVSGKKSLQLTSKNHTGFIEKELPINDPKQLYLVTFAYKNVQGNAPSFTVLQGNAALLFSGGKLSASHTWQQHEAYIRLQPQNTNKGKAHIFFYTSGSSDQASQNLFDNIQVFTINKETTEPLSLPTYRSDYSLADFRYQTPTANTYQNLLGNPSFEDDWLWGPAQDATAGASGTALVQAEQSSDAEEGHASLKLSSKNHTAYVAKTVGHYDANTVYKLSFYYKHVAGRNPAFAVWQDGSSLAQPSQELKGQAGAWNYFETYFVPDKDTTNLALYLYSPSIGEHTVNLFDNIDLEPTSLVATYLEQISTPAAQPDNLVASYQRISPTAVSVRVRQGAGMVVFNESFQKNWKAYAVSANAAFGSLTDKLLPRANGQAITTHVMVNGFANGWWVDSSQYTAATGNHDYQILLVYAPQTTMAKGFVISGFTMAGVSGYFVIDARQRRVHRRYVWRKSKR